MQRTNDRNPNPASSSFASLTDPRARAQEQRARSLRIGLYSVGAIAVLAFSMGWNPPSGRVHSFTQASDHSATKDAGCTNSGEGCHGDESSYADFNAYHPDSDCTTCHDHQGVGCLPCHSPKGRECQTCHDGTMEKAGDRVRITDPYPKGHYRETTHTATGTDMRAAMRATKGGKAKATCGSCHARDLMKAHTKVPVVDKSPYGDSVGCGECHNDERSGGLEQVLADWKARRCEDCHTRESSSPMHSAKVAPSVETTDEAGCGSTGPGCHETSDLHGLHGDRPKDCSTPGVKGEPVCHDLEAQAHATSEYRCGDGVEGCHVTYESDRYSHEKDASLHRAGLAVATASLTDPLTGTTTSCIGCHRIELTDEHGRLGSALAVGNVCRNCHGRNTTTARAVERNWPARMTAQACLDCHGQPGVPAPHTSIDLVHEGVPLDERGIPDAQACSGTVCHETTELREVHAGRGCTLDGCHSAGGAASGVRVACGGGPRDGGCHAGYSTFDGHKRVAGKHRGIEIGDSGRPTRGACARAGCHTTTDLTVLHPSGCEIDGCHQPGVRPTDRSCGGPDDAPCHTGFSETQHFADHNADRTGTVRGVSYAAGMNGGCFGCHSADLVTAHTATPEAPITGGGASSCRVCHHDPADPGNGRYAGLPAVVRATESSDVRCVACHASGTAKPSETHAASAHRRFSRETVRPLGTVWADPFESWAAAFRSPAGGGHNVVSGAVVGSAPTRPFPITEYVTGGTTYRWALPPNTGATKWLKPSGGVSFDSLEEIRHAQLSCTDCHVLPADMTGPHGSAVPVSIDPEYSQTEYANPSRGLTSQFAATGTDRVVCMKCHNLSFGSVPGSDQPGGNPVHAQHARHLGAPAHHPLRYGEKCIDCHVRIPHASRSPRLLIRTIPSANRPADVFPYVDERHDGLAGILLRSFDKPTDLTRSTCVTGGCHGHHSENDHPERSDVPTVPLWP